MTRRCIDCPTLISFGSRCPAHQLRRGTSGWARQADSLAVLDRDGHRCRNCGAPCPHPKHHEVDHVMPLSRGGADSALNKRTLCRACHAAKTRLEAGAHA